MLAIIAGCLNYCTCVCVLWKAIELQSDGSENV
jgi:hypothetical protein